MQKISGIIPSSNRVTQVDMKESSPIRAGMPSFGRNVVKPRGSVNVNKSQIDAAISEKFMTDNQRREVGNQKIVGDMAASFFMHKSPRAQELSAELKSVEASNISESIPKNVGAVDSSLSSELMDEPEYLAPGSYIDVKA